VRDCYILAEAGVNHNGSLDLALRLIDAAADAGADGVKFQTFSADRLAAKSTPKAAYQTADGAAGESQYEMLKRLELSFADHRRLVEHCRDRDIAFSSTAFDIESLEFLLDLGIPFVKIPSGELTNAPLIWRAARTDLPLVVSTGMADLDEVRGVMRLIALAGRGIDHPTPGALATVDLRSEEGRAARDRTTLLHCTTAYPTPPAAVNLAAMATLSLHFDTRAGYSDHTRGIHIPVAAVARGARFIEKHFTLDRGLPGPDHAASLEPAELAMMVRQIRDVQAAIGSGDKIPDPIEAANAEVVRKSIRAARPIRAGEPLTTENLAIKRPAGGRPPLDWWSLLGTVTDRDYEADEAIV
jgi:N-acetylneuraminate synthase